MGFWRGFEKLNRLLGLLILPGLDASLTIRMEFLAIGAKTIFAEGFPDFRHELQIISEVVDGIQL